MTREEALELFKKASDVAGNYLEYVEIVSMHNINIVLSEIFNDHEAQLKQAYIDGSNSTNELVQSLHRQIEQLKDQQ